MIAVASVLGFAVAVDTSTQRVNADRPATPAPSRVISSQSDGGLTEPTPRAVRAAQIHVVGLGDSVMSGTNCACDDYVTGLGRLLASRDHVAVSTTNDGDSGATAADLDVRLRDDPITRRDVASANIVIVTVGANDLVGAVGAWQHGECEASCYRPDIDTMASHLAKVVSQIKTIRGRAPIQIVLTDYWNVFADGDVAENAENDGYLDRSDHATREANSAIWRAVRGAGVTGVDLYSPFKPDSRPNPTQLLASDGDHPNAAGTALISAALISAAVLSAIKPVN